MSKPRYQMLYRLGLEVNSQIADGCCQASYAEIGKELGVSGQTAFNICIIALGKLAYHARKSVKNEL